MKRRHLPILAAAALAIAPSPAESCTCLPPTYESSAAVILVEVIDVRPEDRSPDKSDSGSWRVRVERIWKGSYAHGAVLSSDGDTLCGTPGKVGDRLIVYLQPDGIENFYISSCNAHVVSKSTRAELERLDRKSAVASRHET